MIFVYSPDCFATSVKLTPRGVPAIGEGIFFVAGRGFASYVGREFVCGPIVPICGGMASAKTSSSARTNAERESERRNPRRLQIKGPALPAAGAQPLHQLTYPSIVNRKTTRKNTRYVSPSAKIGPRDRLSESFIDRLLNRDPVHPPCFFREQRQRLCPVAAVPSQFLYEWQRSLDQPSPPPATAATPQPIDLAAAMPFRFRAQTSLA